MQRSTHCRGKLSVGYDNEIKPNHCVGKKAQHPLIQLINLNYCFFFYKAFNTKCTYIQYPIRHINNAVGRFCDHKAHVRVKQKIHLNMYTIIRFMHLYLKHQTKYDSWEQEKLSPSCQMTTLSKWQAIKCRKSTLIPLIRITMQKSV